MIQAEQIRRWNIIAFDDGSNDIVKVEYPFQDEDETWFIKWTKISGDGSFDKGNSLLEDFIPIPLSHDILEKCGFVKRIDDMILDIDDDTFLCKYPDSEDVFLFHDFIIATKYMCRIQYLHQLQNLIFCLTGNELTYKP